MRYSYLSLKFYRNRQMATMMRPSLTMAYFLRILMTMLMPLLLHDHLLVAGASHHDLELRDGIFQEGGGETGVCVYTLWSLWPMWSLGVRGSSRYSWRNACKWKWNAGHNRRTLNNWRRTTSSSGSRVISLRFQ